MNSPEDRFSRRGHQGGVIWLTGLSGAGKSTLAVGLERRLVDTGIDVVVLDGDDMRKGLCSDLGFGRADRRENIRRVAEVAAALAQTNLLCIASLISPFADDRAMARAIVTSRGRPFLEVFVDAALTCCQERDPKGLYQQARRGAIASFTGVSDLYERPLAPDVRVRTDIEPVDQSVEAVLSRVTLLFQYGRTARSA